VYTYSGTSNFGEHFHIADVIGGISFVVIVKLIGIILCSLGDSDKEGEMRKKADLIDSGKPFQEEDTQNDRC